MKSIKLAVAVFVVLVILGLAMTWTLATGEEPEVELPKPIETAKSRIIAKQELQAFTLLKGEHLEARTGSIALGQKAPNVEQLSGRYLLVNVKQGAEVKEEMVAPPDATQWLSDAVAVSIPVTATTYVGGQLRVGDLVGVVAVPSKENKEVKKFENLMVLNIVQVNKESNLPNAMLLAIPHAQRDDFASAVAGAELLVTRRIVIK